MVSSIYEKIASVNVEPITIGTPFLSAPMNIVNNELSPGKAGHMRIWFCIITSDGASTAMAATVHNDLTGFEFFFNADNSFEIKSGGLYWFDIPIIETDQINLQSKNSPDGVFPAKEITLIKLLRFQKIVFGA